MDLTEARDLIDSDRLWLPPGVGKVFVGVRVKGARVSYGRTQVRVEPLSGRGARWVDVDSTTDVED
jgi:hypothetical protein